MGKLSALKEGLEKAVKHLDMSQAARMQRAAEQGFDTSKVWYHGTDADVQSFDLSKLGLTTGAPSARKGIFFASNQRMANYYPQYSSDFLLEYGGYKMKKGETAEQFRNRVATDGIHQKAVNAAALYNEAEYNFIKEARKKKVIGDSYTAMQPADKIYADEEGNFLPLNEGNKKIEEAEKILQENGLLEDLKKLKELKRNKEILEEESSNFAYLQKWSEQSWAGGNEDDAWDAAKENFQPNIMPVFSNLKDEDLLIHDFGGTGYRDVSYNDLLAAAQEQGKKGALFKNTADPTPGDVLVVFDPANVRSKFAAFDPAQKESSNLLASLAPAAVGTGLAALGLSPDETQAAINRYMQMTQPQNAIMQNLENNLQQFGTTERGVPVTGEMRATPFPGLSALADVVRTPQAPGIGPLFGGAADYLDKLGQGQYVGYSDRLGAALDIIP